MQASMYKAERVSMPTARSQVSVAALRWVRELPSLLQRTKASTGIVMYRRQPTYISDWTTYLLLQGDGFRWEDTPYA